MSARNLASATPAPLPSSRSDRELAPFRPGLHFSFYNTLNWQIALGTPLVLFAEQLGATPFQAGLTYSFMFLLTPVQILSTALLPRFGYKRLTLGGWGLRSFVLLVPLALAPAAAWFGASPWMVTALIGASFSFCLLRAVGMAASLPWFYAILPPEARGRYFASDQQLSGIASVLTLLVCAGLFALLPVYAALFAQYLISVLGSVASFYALKKLPDGPVPTPISLKSVARSIPRLLGTPSLYRRHLWVTVGFALFTTPFAPFAAYYLKSVGGVSPCLIMLFEVVRNGGGIGAASALKHRLDARGARPFLLLSLALHAGLGAYWLLFVPTGLGGRAGLFAAYLAMGAAGTCWLVANLGYLPKITSVEDRTLMVTLQGALAALAGGVAVALWGLALRPAAGEAIHSTAFQALFASGLVGCLLLGWRLARVPEPSEQGAGSSPNVAGKVKRGGGGALQAEGAQDGSRESGNRAGARVVSR